MIKEESEAKQTFISLLRRLFLLFAALGRHRHAKRERKRVNLASANIYLLYRPSMVRLQSGAGRRL